MEGTSKPLEGGGLPLGQGGSKGSPHCLKVNKYANTVLFCRSFLRVIELGINFSHIQAKSLTVLNPLRRIDEHIMDDADLAGPLLFCFCFATFLLLVSHL
jgi:hypothetical protein